MKIPQPQQIIEIEHGQERGDAVVSSVIPRRDLGKSWWVWLSVNLKLSEGDHITLTTEEGRFPKLAVHETEVQNSNLLIRICVYEGLLANPSK